MSFTAIVVACHIMNPNNCLTFVDNRGPYETAARCETRMQEMIMDLSTFWAKERLPMGYKVMECVEDYKEGTPA
tara:strand:+ start:288 stop:509 length:222 start_codon:yes stop_codon:yes gene_type:complete